MFNILRRKGSWKSNRSVWPVSRLEIAACLLTIFALFSTAGCSAESFADDETGLWFFVLVKSSNYSQSSAGQLTLLNYHFFSEIFPKPGYADSLRGRMIRHDAPGEPMQYEDRGANFYIEGGHFNTVEEADQAYPNGQFTFEIENKFVEISVALNLSGTDGKTEIPEPIHISLLQGNQFVSPLGVDVAKPLLIRWSEYSNGAADQNGIVDDMIFLVVQNCRGQRIVHTGLPFENADYLTYRARELTVDAGTFRPGEPYAMFVEFPHVIDSIIVDGVPGFTSYATATYLDIQTTGEAVDSACLDEMPAMDTGQTERQETQ